jgi:hypothetical protein
MYRFETAIDASGAYVAAGASRTTLPPSRSFITAAAVKLLVMDAMQNVVSPSPTLGPKQLVAARRIVESAPTKSVICATILALINSPATGDFHAWST